MVLAVVMVVGLLLLLQLLVLLATVGGQLVLEQVGAATAAFIGVAAPSSRRHFLVIRATAQDTSCKYSQIIIS